MGVLDGIVEAYTGERGFMGVHRYKVFGILEVAAKTGRAETNGASGASDGARPWEETHRQFSEAMKERLEPYRGKLSVEPHQMRGTFEECRYVSRVLSRAPVDADPNRSIGLVTLDIQDTGITFMPGDRLAVMPLNSWEECAKVAAALGLQDHLDTPVEVAGTWARFEQHLASVKRSRSAIPKLTVADILRRGHLAPVTKSLALQLHGLLQTSSHTVLQVLATTEWPVRGSLGDLLQDALMDTPPHIWDKAFDLSDLSWLADLVSLEVPRTYSIASYSVDLLPSTVDLAVARAEYDLCATFSQPDDARTRAGVSSSCLNPWPTEDSQMASDDEMLIGVSRPAAFQLPIDSMAPCAFFAGGSGIAPFRGFWQYRLANSGLSGGSNYLYLGVQSREKFCFEEELRELAHVGFMQVHVAFSRDSRGLTYDPSMHDLVERETRPRYIDGLIVEQGATVCDLVTSKRQGGLGGYLYICGSVSVFDSVMSGIRKAIYNFRTATMDNVDIIVDKAFAERRIMLDVFMTPQPLSCSLPTIAASELALHTGHRPGSRMWIAVHGSVYDVTDFCPMHPGGTLIIKSNAGVDCSASFDNLAHTNNPEVSSLLTKYLVGQLAPKPDYHGSSSSSSSEVSALHDLWSAYLRSTVETLVAHQFEMYEIMGASSDTSSAHNPAGSNNIWMRESLPNIIAIRTFYAYQSRLLQGGFAALFGAKLQELVLKLSFALASTRDASADTWLPDVLGTVTRAKTSADAAVCTKEVGLVGRFVCDTETSLRFQERGIFAYASKSVELDIELLEDLRQEACVGMDAFDSVAADMNSAWDSSEDGDRASDRLVALSAFLLQILERMARRLAVFYAQLAQCSVYHPELEHNPARTRWALVRRYVYDGSLFVLAQKAESEMMLDSRPSSYYMSKKNPNKPIDFDKLMSQVHRSLGSGRTADAEPPSAPLTLNAMHQQRGRSTGTTSAVASRENAGALRAMSLFVEKNRKVIRRLSKLPTAPLDLEGLRQAAAQIDLASLPPANNDFKDHSHNEEASVLAFLSGHTATHTRSSSRSRQPAFENRVTALNRSRQSSLSRSSSRGPNAPYPVLGGSPELRPQTDAHAAMATIISRLNTRSRVSTGSSSATASSSARSSERASTLRTSHGSVSSGHSRNQSSRSWLRSFKLKGLVEQNELKIAPTF